MNGDMLTMVVQFKRMKTTHNHEHLSIGCPMLFNDSMMQGNKLASGILPSVPLSLCLGTLANHEGQTQSLTISDIGVNVGRSEK